MTEDREEYDITLAAYLQEVQDLIAKYKDTVTYAGSTNKLLADMFNSGTQELINTVTIADVTRSVPECSSMGDVLFFKQGQAEVVVNLNDLTWNVTCDVSFNNSKAHDDMAAAPAFARATVAIATASAEGSVDLITYLKLKSEYVKALFSDSVVILTSINEAISEG